MSTTELCFDSPGMFQILPDRCTVIAKRELFYLFPIGLVCWLSGFLLVDPKKAMDSIVSVTADNLVQDNVSEEGAAGTRGWPTQEAR